MIGKLIHIGAVSEINSVLLAEYDGLRLSMWVATAQINTLIGHVGREGSATKERTLHVEWKISFCKISPSQLK
jgi:hypothetical protein